MIKWTKYGVISVGFDGPVKRLEVQKGKGVSGYLVRAFDRTGKLIEGLSRLGSVAEARRAAELLYEGILVAEARYEREAAQ
jgi:hypothetical protein